MLNQNTKHYNFEEITTGLEDIGAQLSLNSDRDLAAVSLRSLTKPSCLNKAIKIFTDVVTMPDFAERDFRHMQKMTIGALIRQTQMPEIIAKNAFYDCLYDEHPYGYSVLGDPPTVMGLTVADIKSFYKQHYVAANAFITIVGNVTPLKAKRIADHVSLQLQMGKAANKPPQAHIIRPVATQRISYPSKQTSVLLGQVGISFDDKNYLPYIVGNQILGGSSLTSRLFKKVRQEYGLTYSIISSVAPLMAKGPFVIMFQSRNEEVAKALKLTIETVKSFISQGPTRNELTAVKKMIINGFPLNIASNQDIGSHLQRIAFYNLPLTYLDDYTDKIKMVSIKEIKEAFQESFSVNEMVKVIVGG